MSESGPNCFKRGTWSVMRGLGVAAGATRNGFNHLTPFLRSKGKKRKPVEIESFFKNIEFSSKLERIQAEVYVRDIESDDPTTRIEAVEQLKNLTKPVAVGILRRLLATKGSPARIVDHLNALSCLNGDASLDRKLFRDFLQHPNSSIRVAALRAVSVYRDDESFSILSSAVEDPDAEVRRQALNLQCWTYGDMCTGAVLALLHDPNGHVRRTAALICGTLKLNLSISALITLLSDVDASVQEQAVESLQKITGKNLGFDHSGTAASKKEAVEAWRFWWRDNQSTFAADETTKKDRP